MQVIEASTVLMCLMKWLIQYWLTIFNVYSVYNSLSSKVSGHHCKFYKYSFKAQHSWFIQSFCSLLRWFMTSFCVKILWLCSRAMHYWLCSRVALFFLPCPGSSVGDRFPLPPGVDTSPSGIYKCGICNVGFESREKLDEHKKIHSLSGFLCHVPPCPKRFTNPMFLKDHLLKDHGCSYVHFCLDCGKGFKSSVGYNNHHKLYHGGAQGCPSCHICGKIFPTKSNLLVHLKKHSIDRPFTCQKCGKSYKYKQTYKDHYCN